MGKTEFGVFAMVVPFLISTCGGTLIAVALTLALAGTGALRRMQDSLK